MTLYLDEWRKITTDKWVLRIVAEGYLLRFKSPPPSLPPTGETQRMHPLLLQEVDSLLQKNAIEIVPRPQQRQGIYSRYFLVQKRGLSEEYRPILDLRQLNRFIRKEKFRMLALHQIFPHLHQGDWMCSIDLQDAYFHIPVSPHHRRFLRFLVGPSHFQFRVLPFGLRSAPRTFSKCMAVVAAFLRKKGIFVYPYLDDWLLKAPTPSSLQIHLSCTLQLMESLGLKVNLKKSILNPTQKIHYLGASLNTASASVSPSEERFSSIQTKCHTLLHTATTTVRQVSSLLGMMASCIFIVHNARLHMRPLQQALEDQWSQTSGRWDDQIVLPQSAKDSFKWWTDRLNIMKGVPFHQEIPKQTIVTDASLVGWGAHMSHLQVQGLWSEVERGYHINFLELRAVHLALKCFLPSLGHNSILIQTDNTTTMFYLNKQGGTKSRTLSLEAQTIWHWLLKRNLTVTAVHVPGVLNKQADTLSRDFLDAHDWELNDQVLQDLFREWGTPSIDLFADANNAKCRAYASRYPQRGSSGNALVIKWKQSLLYAFPPLPLIPMVITKFTKTTSRMILIAPEWPRQWWYPDLLQMSEVPHRRLPCRPDLLSKNQGRVFHPNLPSLRLTAWLLRSCSMAI